MLALLSLPAQGAARYQVCDFTCAEPANASWLACRAEKCTPRLPEDRCSEYPSDGSDLVRLARGTPATRHAHTSHRLTQ